MKHALIYALVSGLVLGSVSGCDDAALTQTGSTSSGPPVGTAVIPQGKSLIYLYRTRDLAASINTFSVFVDGVEVAQMQVGSVHQQAVAPGNRLLKVETTPNLLNAGLALALQARPTLQVAAASGGSVYIEISARDLDGSPQLRVVDRATATAATAGFTTAKAL